MARFIIFVGLLALTRCTLSENVKSEGLIVKELNIQYGGEAHLQVYVDAIITNCVVELNNGSTYSYRRYDEIVPDKIKSPYSYHGFDCTLDVKNVDENDAGYWTIKVYQRDVKEPQVFMFRLNVEKLIKDKEYISVYEGHYTYLTVDKVNTEFVKLSECQITDPEGNKYKMGDSDDFQQFGQCGIRMLVTNTTISGEWAIVARFSDFYIIKSTYTVKVLTDESEKYNNIVISLERGKQETISVGPKSVTHCRMRDPKGVEQISRTKRCYYKIPTVTANHEGVWTALYGLAGKMDPIKITFNVTTYETTELNTTVETGENGEISFACHFHTSDYLSCQFIRPDGAILDYTPNVANGDYSSYGNATSYNDKPLFCGLKIWQPREWDYGAWKCYVTLQASFSDTRVIGTLVQIRRPPYHIAFPFIKTESKDVVVRQGDSFQVSCNANEVLSYCWLRSPNGTDFSIVKDVGRSSSPRILHYEGSGLSLGDCRATLPAADDTHQGEWKCFMGIRNGTELEERLDVAVTDSYLIADKQVIPVYDNIPRWIYMSCRLHPYLSDKSIDYCRWVRPDGYGINNIENENYLTRRNSTVCSILVSHAENNVNIGKWTCVAGLTGSSEQEAWAYIKVQRMREGLSMTYIILISVAVVIVISTATGLLITQLRKRKRPLLDQPHVCPSEAYLPPKYS